MTESKVQTLDVSYIPRRKADETLFTVLVTENYDSKLAYIHFDKHGYYNVYSTLYDMLNSLMNGNAEKRIETFDDEGKLDEFLVKKY